MSELHLLKTDSQKSYTNKKLFMQGNKSLLSLPKVGFLASRTVSLECVFRCYDWACAMRDEGQCIMSGFNSKLEKDVLRLLLQGTQPIVVVLGRALYKKIPSELEDAYTGNRLLIISPVIQTITRQSEKTAFLRNEFIVSNSTEMVFASVTEKSSLWKLKTECEKTGKSGVVI